MKTENLRTCLAATVFVLSAFSLMCLSKFMTASEMGFNLMIRDSTQIVVFQNHKRFRKVSSNLESIFMSLQRGGLQKKVTLKESLKKHEDLEKFINDSNFLTNKILKIISDKSDLEVGDEDDAKTKNEVTAVKNSGTIIYNRINKSGSASLLTLLSGLGAFHEFLVIGQGASQLRYFLEPSQKTQLAKVLCQQRKMLFTRHVFYTDFRPWGCNISYFNMMRDPVSRFVSRYNFNRELLIKARSSAIKEQAVNMSSELSRCVVEEEEECRYSGTLPRLHALFRLDSQLPFFCGDSEDCRTLGHKDAVSTSIANIESSFIVVGLLEQLEKTMYVLECLIPDYTAGLSSLYSDTSVHRNSKHKTGGDVLTEEARRVMVDRLGPEYVLYRYVENRLEQQYRLCKGREGNQ